MPFQNIRTRLLVWYFVLATATTGSALLVTRQIFCDRLDEKAETSLQKEVQRFERITAQSPSDASSNIESDLEASTLLDRFLADYVPAKDEIVITFIGGQLYRTSQPLPDWLQRNSALTQRWANLTEPQRQRIASPDQRLFYIAEPLITEEGLQGTFVVVFSFGHFHSS
ncbi:MAG: hypothetical protein AAFZ17_07765 [Cyanobacteria bacterium J06650_10]